MWGIPLPVELDLEDQRITPTCVGNTKVLVVHDSK